MADMTSRAGESYATPLVISWLHATHTTHDAALSHAFDAPTNNGMPAIQVGPAEGALLALLLQMVGARKVVEIGTLAGYSAIHMARALPEDGHLWSLEFDAKHAAVARANIDAAGLSGRVTVIDGPALESLPALECNGPFDAVFVDADKQNYDAYGRWAAKHVRKGGLLLGDNAFFFGHLLEDSPAANAMRRFHEEARNAFKTVCIPTPDGLLLGVKT
jgi:caffeoyl-CoA O-methyltransferase